MSGVAAPPMHPAVTRRQRVSLQSSCMQPPPGWIRLHRVAYPNFVLGVQNGTNKQIKKRLFTSDIQNDAHSPSRMHEIVLSSDQRPCR